MDYTIKAKKIVYNTITNSLVNTFSGKPGEVIFDSIGEYRCYKVLEQLHLPIEVHKFIPHLGYKVDFAINFLTDSHKNIPLLVAGYSLYRNKTLYVEYKGVLDPITISRLSVFPTIIVNNIVVVTDKPDKITYFNVSENDIVTIPTLSVKQLRELICQ